MNPRLSLPKTALLGLSAIAALASVLAVAGCGGGSSAPAAVDSSTSLNMPCSRSFASLDEVQGAIAKAPPHAVICLSDGDYGKFSLDAGARPTRVTVRAENPAGATIEGAELDGDNLTLAGFVSTEGIQVMPGATGIDVEHNRVTGGGQGIDAGPTTTTTVNDTRIVGNQLIGPFGEDAIHLNRYHDSDGDGIGVLIEGNEITSVRENGATPTACRRSGSAITSSSARTTCTTTAARASSSRTRPASAASRVRSTGSGSKTTSSCATTNPAARRSARASAVSRSTSRSSAPTPAS